MTPELRQCFELNSELIPQNQRTRLLDLLQQQLQNVADSYPDAAAELAQVLTGDALVQWQRVLIGSTFAAQTLCRHPIWWLEQLREGHLQRPWQAADFVAQMPDAQTASPEQWDVELRRWRNRTMARIIWRDFNRLADTRQTTAELTLMAELAIQQTLDYHYPRLCAEMGTPVDKNGQPQPLLILGMGKLGAWELNLSSDIDLIFAFPRSGDTQGAPRSYTNQEFFTRLGQRLIKSLDSQTPEGFVFRVDMRLRPYGQSGALVSNFDALEDYYQTQGREWERFAMIKARVVASNGSAAHKDELMSLLRSFTYRGYVDFSAIDALRNLKQLINREVARRRASDNVKIGQGGIREVEFIAQAFQIIRGGRDTELQDRRLLHILPLLRQLNCLPEGVDERLTLAYCFLRDVEHALQGYEDKQTQELPHSDLDRKRTAYVMGFADWDSFYQALNSHREFVREQFNAVVATPDNQAQDADHQQLQAWRVRWHQISGPEADPSRSLAEFDEGERAAQLLREHLLAAPSVAAMAALSRERFDNLMPRLLQRLSKSAAPCVTLQRVIPLLVATARRSAYLLLLTENPGALNQLVLLTEASPWIASELARHPALLDELLDPNTLYTVPPRKELEQELRQQVLRVAEDDLEQQMEALRYFRSAHALRVAACEITGKLPLMKVSDYLTELAEVILAYVLRLAWQQMTLRHGFPDGDSNPEPNFLIVAYGKLGGLELAHGSDLDLVFIHDADAMGSTTGDSEGQRSLDNATFFARLGQKIIHILNTQTPSGQLYEVDMRLRPSGNSGLLVTRFSAFEKYQFETAWTWEHQALVRARAIVGRAPLRARFDDLRQRVLRLPREQRNLQREVVEMRQKMRDQLGSNKRQQTQGQFHLKQDAGGIVDIEFMVQYAVLAWSCDNPALVAYTDNIRILGCLAESGLLSAQEVHQLIEAYKAYRSLGHRLALQQLPSVVTGDQVESERRIVTQIWQRLLNFDPAHATHS